MTDILLIQPPIRDFYLTRKRTLPYGLAGIASALKTDGFQVEIFDGLASAKSRPLEMPPEMAHLAPYYGRPDSAPFGLFHRFFHFGYSYGHLAKTARESGAWLVGISALFTAYSDEALETAAIVKAELPECKIVLGGHHPTSLPEAVMAHPAVDFVIRGEGEAAMPQLAAALRNGGDVSRIPGIVFRTPNGALRISDPVWMEIPEAFPLPALELTRHKFYERRRKRAAVITTSRGCPLKCTYCAMGQSARLPYRQRSVASVLQELDAQFRRHKMGFIDFEDENISLDKNWFLTLLMEISRRYGHLKPELRAMNGLYPPSLDETVIRTMKAAGFRILNLALGTTCREQQHRFQRPDVTRDFDRCLDVAEKYGLDAVGYLIAGAPAQQPASTLADLLYLARRRVLAGVSVFYPAPGSPDYEKCKAMGLLPDSFSLMRSTALPISHTTHRTAAVTFLRLGRVLNYIKQRIDDGLPIPNPGIAPPKILIPENRSAAGDTLLAQFLHDGSIMGVDAKGRVYAHRIDKKLTLQFLEGLKGMAVRGVTSTASRFLKVGI